MRLRAAAHVHSDWSYDGHWPLEKIAQVFRRLGFKAVLMTEHDRDFTEERWQKYREACENASRWGTLLIPGIEFSDPENVVHVLTWGDWSFPGESLPTRMVVEHVMANGGIAVLAHASRKQAWNRIPSDLLQKFSGIELWNRKNDGWATSGDAGALLRNAPGAVAYVGLDFHKPRQLFPLSMHLRVESLTRMGVLDALRRRRCTARALGLPVGVCAAGGGAMLLRHAEHVRQVVASVLRRLRRRAVVR